MSKLRLVVIGCLGRGRLVKLCHLNNMDAKIVAGCDINTANLEIFKKEYKEEFNQQVNCYLDYREMLEKEEPDGVFIMTPDHYHEEQALQAIKAGIPLFLEKPLSISTDSCDRIIEAASASQIKIMVGHNMRYMWFTNKMKEIIDSGLIGNIQAIWVRHFVSYGAGYFRKWYSERAHINGLLLQKGAHDIDIIHWLANAYTRRVSAFGKLSVYNHLPRRAPHTPPPVYKDRQQNWPPPEQKDFSAKIDIEDHNMLLMELENGVQASYTQCFYTPDSCRNYTVIGDRGRLENYGDLGGNCTIQVWTNRRDTFRIDGDITYREPPQDGSGHGGADAKTIQAFISYLRDGTITNASLNDARNAVACGCAGTESLRNGNIPVTVIPYSDK